MMFSKIIDMTIISSVFILLVIVLRFALRKESKHYSYMLWVLVLINLVLPAFINNPFSLISKSPSSMFFNELQIKAMNSFTDKNLSFSTKLSDKNKEQYRQLNNPINQEKNKLTSSVENDLDTNTVFQSDSNTNEKIKSKRSSSTNDNLNLAQSQNNLQSNKELQYNNDIASNIISNNLYTKLSIIWFSGLIVFLSHSVYTYIKIKHKLKKSHLKEKGIYYNHTLESAFVFGLFRPKIYLSNKLSEKQEEVIILHEKTHIRRFDHVFRILAYIALSLHWFNPLVHLAYHLSSKDMEFSCDEMVMNSLKKEEQLVYTQSLLDLASGKTALTTIPVAFGDGDVKGRIKNMLNYKKPKLWVSILIVCLVLILTAACVGTSNNTALEDSNKLGVNNEQSHNESLLDSEKNDNTKNNDTATDTIHLQKMANYAIQDRIVRLSSNSVNKAEVAKSFDIEFTQFDEVASYDRLQILKYDKVKVFEVAYRFTGEEKLFNKYRNMGKKIKVYELEDNQLPMDLKKEGKYIVSDTSHETHYIVFLEDEHGNSFLAGGRGLITINNNKKVLATNIKSYLLGIGIEMDLVSCEEAVAAINDSLIYGYEHYALRADGGIGIKIVDSQTDNIRKLGEYDDIIEGQKFTIYGFDIKIKPADMSQVIFAGGMLQEDGWLTNFSSLGRTAIVIRKKTEMAHLEYLGLVSEQDGAYDEKNKLGMQRKALRELLERNKIVPNETYPGNHAVFRYVGYDSEGRTLLLSQPAKQGKGGIWCVERSRTVHSFENFEYPMEKNLKEHYKILQAEVDSGKNTHLLNPMDVAYQFVSDRSPVNFSLVDMEQEFIENASLKDYQKPIEYDLNVKLKEIEKDEKNQRIFISFYKEKMYLNENSFKEAQFDDKYYDLSELAIDAEITLKTDKSNVEKISIDKFINYISDLKNSNKIYRIRMLEKNRSTVIKIEGY